MILLYDTKDIRLISDIISDRILSGSSAHGCQPKRHKLSAKEISSYCKTLLNIELDVYDIYENMSHKKNLNITKGKRYKQTFQ